MSWQELAPILEGLAGAAVLCPLVCGWRPSQRKPKASKPDYDLIYRLEHELEMLPHENLSDAVCYVCHLERAEKFQRENRELQAKRLAAQARRCGCCHQHLAPALAVSSWCANCHRVCDPKPPVRLFKSDPVPSYTEYGLRIAKLRDLL